MERNWFNVLCALTLSQREWLDPSNVGAWFLFCTLLLLAVVLLPIHFLSQLCIRFFFFVDFFHFFHWWSWVFACTANSAFIVCVLLFRYIRSMWQLCSAFWAKKKKKWTVKKIARTHSMSECINGLRSHEMRRTLTNNNHGHVPFVSIHRDTVREKGECVRVYFSVINFRQSIALNTSRHTRNFSCCVLFAYTRTLYSQLYAAQAHISTFAN